jgi:hypothetical protein
MSIVHNRNINGSAFPYNPSAGGSVYRYNLSQGRSYNPKRSTSNFLDVSGNGVVGTAYSISNEYYPSKYGGMIYLNNTTGYQPTQGNGLTVNLAVSTSNEITFIVAWEYVASNLTYGADIIAGAYAGSTHDWWIGQTGYSSSQPYWFSRNGTGYTLGIAPVVGRRYIAVVGNSSSTNAGYFYLFDSAGNSYSNTSIGGVQLSTAGPIALGKYGGWNDNYMPRCYFGDAIYSNTYLSTTAALAIKDKIKYRYGISV